MKIQPVRLLLFMVAFLILAEVAWCPINVATASGSYASGPLTDNPNVNPRPVVSASYYYIIIDKQTEVVTVLRQDSKGKYTIIDRQMKCSTGKTPGRTPVGTFKINGTRYRWRASNPKYHEYMQFACRINGVILIHSVTYKKTNPNALDRDSYLNLGKPVSAGCIRLTVRDAKWIYTNCPNGTVVKVVASGGPTVVTLTSTPALPANATYDPTDTSIVH